MYKNARALEQAVKAAAKESPLDTNKAIRNFYHDRFLCRVFSEPEPAFILKGGQSMIARIINARSTRDIDLLYRDVVIDQAVRELKRIAAIDLGDYLEFRYVKAEAIVANQDCREGYKVCFTPVLGGTKQQSDISIDLIVDQVICVNPDKVASISRLNIDGLESFDYLLYPIADALVDKICAIMQSYPDGRVSSRVKDLVDLVAMITTQNLDFDTFSKKVQAGVKLLGIGDIDAFRVPYVWRTSMEANYRKLAEEAWVVERCGSVEAAEALVKRCVDPALQDRYEAAVWDVASVCWVEGR